MKARGDTTNTTPQPEPQPGKYLPISTEDATEAACKYLQSLQVEGSSRIVREFCFMNCRADIALIGPQWIGVEIKSDTDTSIRLYEQMLFYEMYFPRSIVVVTEKHLKRVQKITDDFACSWGLAIARRGRDGAVWLDWKWTADESMQVELGWVLGTAWREELVALCASYGLHHFKSWQRQRLQKAIVESKPDLDELRQRLTLIMLARESWRPE